MEIVLPRRIKRKKTSIFVDPELWDNFVTNCKNRSQSTCHVLEGMMEGFNRACDNLEPRESGGTFNIQLVVNRVVQRIRRVEH